MVLVEKFGEQLHFRHICLVSHHDPFAHAARQPIHRKGDCDRRLRSLAGVLHPPDSVVCSAMNNDTPALIAGHLIRFKDMQNLTTMKSFEDIRPPCPLRSGWVLWLNQHNL